MTTLRSHDLLPGNDISTLEPQALGLVHNYEEVLDSGAGDLRAIEGEASVMVAEIPPVSHGALEPHEKRIFLLRHGQGEHNVHLNGRDLPDPPLTALGCEQANWWAAEMPKIAQPEVVLLSPLTRTLQTGLRAFQNCSTRFEVCRHARERPFQDKCNLPNQDLSVVRRLLESEPRGHEILALDGKQSHTGILGTGGLQEGFTDLPETDWDSTLHGKDDESRWLADRDRVHHASLHLLVKELCHRQETTIAVSAHYNTIQSIMWPQEVRTGNGELVEAVLNTRTGQLTSVKRHECPLATRPWKQCLDRAITYRRAWRDSLHRRRGDAR